MDREEVKKTRKNKGMCSKLSSKQNKKVDTSTNQLVVVKEFRRKSQKNHQIFKLEKKLLML